MGLIVFCAVVAIVAIIVIIKVVSGKKPAKENLTEHTAAQEPVPQASAAEVVSPATDAEIIAVISAAVAAISGIKSTYNLQIRSIRRQGQSAPIWNAVSRKENLDSRF